MTTHTQNLKISANKLAHICTFRCLPIKSFTNFKGLLSVVSRLYTSSFTCSFLSNCWHDCCLNIWISMCRSIQRASWVIVEEDSSKWPLGISQRKRPRRIRSDISDTVAERQFDTSCEKHLVSTFSRSRTVFCSQFEDVAFVLLSLRELSFLRFCM